MTLDVKKDLPKGLTKGGPGDRYLGGGKVDTSEWFATYPEFETQIKNQDIWFCAAPFQMIYTNTRGELLPCSWAKEGWGPNIKDVTFREFFTRNRTLNSLRSEMLDPNSDHKMINKICANCKYQEEHYGRSRRQASLKIQTNNDKLWAGMRDAVEKFKDSSRTIGYIGHRIFEVQVKAFGNKCNLDCYMCIPYDSSTRLDTVSKDDLIGQNIFSQYAITPIESLNDTTLDSITDQIVDLAPYIYNMKFIGGEPLVMKKFYTLLERLVETGQAKHITVKYQTNMSVLEFEKLKISKFIPEFLRFEFTVSLDGVGVYNDYIRRRSSWESIVENCKSVLKYPNVIININGTITFLSVLRFYELIEWFEENSPMFDQINWSNIRSPSKLCANVLPDEIKESLIDKYQNFPDIVNVLKEDNHGLEYHDTLDYLLMMDKRYEGTKWEMNLFDIYPELEEFYIPK